MTGSRSDELWPFCNQADGLAISRNCTNLHVSMPIWPMSRALTLFIDHSFSVDVTDTLTCFHAFLQCQEVISVSLTTSISELLALTADLIKVISRKGASTGAWFHGKEADALVLFAGRVRQWTLKKHNVSFFTRDLMVSNSTSQIIDQDKINICLLGPVSFQLFCNFNMYWKIW